jgi:hypothetical protein
MAVTKPYFRTARQLADGSYKSNGNGRYVSEARFAIAGHQYVLAFLLLQKDILELFDFVEPADVNLPCYSFRTHELHMRTCIEVEANCKAILSENGYVRRGDWNMTDYRKLNATHHLSFYEVRTPIWRGTSGKRSPFAPWARSGALCWYQAYNAAKHDRHNQFPLANFENLLDAFCGLVALLSAQFITFDFQPAVYGVGYGGPEGGFDTALGGYFHVKFPTDWATADRYDFNWQALQKDPDPFLRLTF